VQDEISSIAAKRSDFEHLLNARGSQPSDYARYVEYEMNLDSLRRKRVKRKGLKATAHTGTRRIFFILDRGTRKFHGDVGLWMQYLEFARKERANKKLVRILTDVLRMHPTKAELWIYAARYAMDVQADIEAARSYMQRGLRFCKNSKNMYLEYSRLEMQYIAKIAARRRILGLDFQNTVIEDSGPEPPLHERDEDMIALRDTTAGDFDSDPMRPEVVDESTLKSLAATPAMVGAIPMAIFDTAMKQFLHDPLLGERFFDMFGEFHQVPCASRVLQHALDDLCAATPPSISALSCGCRWPLIGVATDSSEFPAALLVTLKRIKAARSTSLGSGPVLAEKLVSWLEPMAKDHSLGPELKMVMTATVRQLSRETEGRLPAM